MVGHHPAYDPGALQELNTLLDLLTRSEFLTGVGIGVVGLAFFLITDEASRPRVWGLIATAVAALAIQLTVGRRIGVTLGLASLALGGWLLKRHESAGTLGGREVPTALAWAMLGTGAIAVTLRGGVGETSWVGVVAPVVVVFGGYWLRSWGDLPPRHLLGLMFAITAFGIWTTVPETATARALLGASLPLAFATARGIDGAIGSGGAFALSGLVVWIGADGGAERPGSIIGAWACLGLLIALPIVFKKVDRLPGWVVLSAHAGWVLLSARLFGLWHSAIWATGGLIALVMVTTGVTAALAPTKTDVRS